MVGRNHHSGIKTTTKLLFPVKNPGLYRQKVCHYTGLTLICIWFCRNLHFFTPVATQHSKYHGYNIGQDQSVRMLKWGKLKETHHQIPPNFDFLLTLNYWFSSEYFQSVQERHNISSFHEPELMYLLPSVGSLENAGHMIFKAMTKVSMNSFLYSVVCICSVL